MRSRRFALLSATIVAFASLSLQTTPARAATQLTGIDVSSWQGSIDWSKVAASGVRFAIAKVTESTTYTDPYYAGNKAGAAANGIAFTAYHFARPTSSTANAVAQADYFVNAASLTAGNLIPALDLEVTGSLSVSALQSWTWAFVQEVYARLGVKPMIYTSPSFWSNAMGNTTAFAAAGYKLWLAHWTTASSPTVPASNWNGNGWTFWQYSDCQKISGISSQCVDGDRFAGSDLNAVRMAALSVSRTGGGPVTSSPSGIACGTTCKSYFDPMSSVSLTATPNSGGTFLGWSGSCSGTGSCSVTMAGNKSVSARFGFTLFQTVSGGSAGSIVTSTTTCSASCSTVYPAAATVTVTAKPGADSIFTGWSGGVCSGTATTCSVWMGSNKQATADFVDKPPSATIATPSSLTGYVRATFDEPVHGVSADNFDLRVSGSSAPVVTTVACFDGSNVAVDCVLGDVRSARAMPSSPFVPGQHYTVTLDPAGAPTQIVDAGALPLPATARAFRGSQLEQESSVAARYGWQTVGSSAALGGSYTRDSLAGATATFRFTGTGVTWYTTMSSTHGMAAVVIDGVSKGTFDLFSASTRYQIARSFSGLTAGTHTLVITVLGKRNARSKGTFVAIDGFKVGSTTYATPALPYTWRAASSSAALGSRYAMSYLSGSASSFTFRGSAITWYTMLGPSEGTANLLIDGKLVGVVDNYSPSLHRAPRKYSVTDGIHTITVVPRNQHDASSNGPFVGVDAWYVG
ncbi:MAG: GH25 family lysozyme [Actinomycetota bacterium]